MAETPGAQSIQTVPSVEREERIRREQMETHSKLVNAESSGAELPVVVVSRLSVNGRSNPHRGQLRMLLKRQTSKIDRETAVQ